MNTPTAEAVPATAELPEVSESLMKMRTRILTGFEAMARDAGPKGVIMTELVSQLGISTKTLYRCFPNKSQLVTELIRSWSIEQKEHQQRRIDSTMTPRDRIVEASLNWLEHYGQFSAGFWLQLERDYPQAQAMYQREYDEFIERSRQNLTPFVKPQLNADLALSGLMVLLDHAGSMEICEQLDITRKTAITQMVNLWADGALMGI